MRASPLFFAPLLKLFAFPSIAAEILDRKARRKGAKEIRNFARVSIAECGGGVRPVLEDIGIAVTINKCSNTKRVSSHDGQLSYS